MNTPDNEHRQPKTGATSRKNPLAPYGPASWPLARFFPAKYQHGTELGAQIGAQGSESDFVLGPRTRAFFKDRPEHLREHLGSPGMTQEALDACEQHLARVDALRAEGATLERFWSVRKLQEAGLEGRRVAFHYLRWVWMLLTRWPIVALVLGYLLLVVVIPWPESYWLLQATLLVVWMLLPNWKPFRRAQGRAVDRWLLRNGLAAG